MFYTIYKITNKINNKFYIGKHQTKNLQDGYMGSGKLIKAAISKYGIDNFTKEILHIFQTEEEMNQAEKYLVVIGEESYNLCEGGKGGFGYLNSSVWTPEKRLQHNQNFPINKRISTEIRKETTKRLWKEGKLTQPPSFDGLKHTQETRSKMSMSHKGKHDGLLNSQYGTCWITNGTENKKIKKDDLDNWISLGYYRGRI